MYKMLSKTNTTYANAYQKKASDNSTVQKKTMSAMQYLKPGQPNMYAPVQRVEDEEDEILQGKFAEPVQREATPNLTGMPDNLKAGVESLSGFSMDSVRVHYNSPRPAKVQALAYTQGTDIHVAPGQERHLPHEAWHVAQQMAGQVQPTTEIGGMPVNDNVGLEHEADVMGGRALQMKSEDVLVDTHKENKIMATANFVAQNKNNVMRCVEFVDNGTVVLSQMKVQRNMVQKKCLGNIFLQETHKTGNRQSAIQRTIVQGTDVDVASPVDKGTQGFEIIITKQNVTKTITMSRKHAIESYRNPAYDYGKNYKPGETNIIVTLDTGKILDDMYCVACQIAPGIKIDGGPPRRMNIPEGLFSSGYTSISYLNQSGTHLFPTDGMATINISGKCWSTVKDIANYKSIGKSGTNRIQARKRWNNLTEEVQTLFPRLFGDITDFITYIQ